MEPSQIGTNGNDDKFSWQEPLKYRNDSLQEDEIIRYPGGKNPDRRN